MKKSLILFLVLQMILFSGAILFAGEAASAPAFGPPISAFDDFYFTACYDLNRSAGSIADWTGWTGTSYSSGHAYDNHSGTDWGMPTGTNLYAIANGTVNAFRESVPNDDHSDTGNYIILDHTNISAQNWRSNCWHLSQWSVVPTNTSDPVTKGVKIAESDNTGNSTGPHLHFGFANISASGYYTCPWYKGWFEDDEFYYGDARPCLRYLSCNASILNCRRGSSSSYDIVTQMAQDKKFVACFRNGWYNFFTPMPPARAYESRNSGGALQTYYSESGTWANSSDKSSVTDTAGDANYTALSGSGTRYSTFSGTGGAETASFTFNPAQRGNYSIWATWPSQANAADVTYRITDNIGTTDVTMDQAGIFTSGGTGAHASPYIIDHVPYIANHTTIGGDDTWDSYSPVGSGIQENGPERIYKLEIFNTTDIAITVDHTGYSGLDVDIQLLGSLSNTDCLARADWEVQYASASPGTYYISIDSFGSDNSAATAYTITVSLNDDAPYPNSWVKLGDFFYANGDTGTVQIRENSVTGKIDAGQEGRVYADAIKVIPEITYRSLWASDTYLDVIDTSSNPVTCVGIKADQTSGNDSQDIADSLEVAIYASAGSGASNSSAIVGKAITGQRFVCTQKTGDWYKVELTEACDASEGWLYGDHLFIYHADALETGITNWSLY